MTLLELHCGDAAGRFGCVARVQASAREAGLGPQVVARLGVAAAELISNVARHGGGQGRLRLSFDADQQLVELEVEDQGPGFCDFERSAQDGYSRGRALPLGTPRTAQTGLGVGLGSVRRLCDELALLPSIRGARVRVRMRVERRGRVAHPVLRVAHV